LYGFGANLIRRQLVGLPAGAVAAATLLCAAVFISPLALATWPSTPIPARSWLCAVLLGVMCTGIAYAVYYRLINRIGAPRASTVTYLVPLFGVLWAWLALGEPPTVTMAVAGALILGGVALNQQWGTPRS
jgi:drug/metabolite transporter (DMT)-like permease